MHALASVRKRKGLGPIDLGFILLLLASPARGDEAHSDVTVTTSMILTQTITTHLGARPTQPANHAGYGLQGCYRRPDNDGDVGLEVKMPLSNAEANGLTTSKCLEACVRASLGKGVESYSFVAVGEGRECYCATKLSPEARSVGSSNCSTPCAGDKNLACGGLDHISVYSLVDAAAAERYAIQGMVTGDPGSPAFLDSGKNRGKTAAVAMGSLAGCATFGLLVFLGCKLYRRRSDLTSGWSRSRMAKETAEKDKHKKDDGVLVIKAPESEETWLGPQRPRPRPPPPLSPLAGLGNHVERREEIMRVQFVHSPHPRSEQGATGGSTAYQQPSAMVPASPLSPADDGLRQRRRSSSKPVDWARFDAVIPNGQFSPTTSPTKDRFFHERPRRASMTVYCNNHGAGSAAYPCSSSDSVAATPVMHPSSSRSNVRGNGDYSTDNAHVQAYRPDNIRVSAWSASTAEPSPQSTTTVGSSILDVSPSSPSTCRLNPSQMAAPAPAATGGLGDRAWSRRRLSTPFPPPGGGSPASSHSSGSRRSSLADIVGDYHGVRVGRVEQLREKEEEEKEEEQQQQQQRDDLMPSPLHVVKWKQSFADMRRAGSGARRGDDGVDDSPVLSVWDIARTTPKVEELSPRESSKGKFEDEMPASPMSAKGTKGLDKGRGGQDKSQGSAENGQDGGKAAPVADELLILPATTFDGGRALAAARNKKMV
ncbi:hypothetical protein PoMZ_12972 [Pyricularia oryzae]|uniref:WSC domain-containing protein n=1 Tax=Pyricularia oryzae TaxID=318829 RepID=A0A4P7NTZ3_PYROR|nr:hypothetical protein PoMZ_12972 [Pyricularia oryzae]